MVTLFLFLRLKREKATLESFNWSTMSSLCVPIGLLLFIGSCACQFPRPCANSEGLLTKECCPVWEGDNSACGVQSGHGKCTNVRVHYAPYGPHPYHGYEDRDKWPLEFFNRTCKCLGNYSGFDCGDCLFGHWGHTCSEYRETVRRNVLKLTAAEKKKLVDYFDQAKNTVNPDYVIATATRDKMGPNGESPQFSNVTTLDIFAWIHYFVVHPIFLDNGEVFQETNFGHMGSGFTVWHRIFLLFFENEIRKMTRDFNFTLPYWDWRDKTECDVCTDDLMGAQDPTDPNLISPGSPFSKWKTICSLPDEYMERRELCNSTREGPLMRNPSNDDDNAHLPTRGEVELMMGFQYYENFRGNSKGDIVFDQSAENSFRNILEGFSNATGHPGGPQKMHNAVHNFMNGSMSFLESAANDPIFYLHHCFVDSLFERWVRKKRDHLLHNQYPRAYAPIGHNWDNHMVPFLPTYTNGEYFISSDLGYDYDYLQEMLNLGKDLDVAVWSDWSEWSDCTRPGQDIRCKTISGTQSRNRRCIRKAYDGSTCPEHRTETRPCYNIRDCLLTGTWSDEWSKWSRCRPSCGSNNSKRFRERIFQPDFSLYRKKIGLHFHGRADVDSGEQPEGTVAKNETQACPFHACGSGQRFDIPRFPPPTSTKIGTDKSCSTGWKQFKESCYNIRTEQNTWELCRKLCLEMESDLPVINSKEELKFIGELRKPGAPWIGLERTGNGWSSVDGTLLNTLYWHSGYPLDDDDSNCAHLYDCVYYLGIGEGCWQNVPCNYERHCICEKSLY